MHPESNLISKEKLKDVLVNRTSMKVKIPPSTVDSVISFIYKDAAKAMKDCTSLELSGFGVFRYSVSKLKTDIKRKTCVLARLNKIENPSENILSTIKNIEKYITDAKTKIDELEKN